MFDYFIPRTLYPSADIASPLRFFTRPSWDPSLRAKGKYNIGQRDVQLTIFLLRIIYLC